MGLLSHTHRLTILALAVQLAAMVFPLHFDEGVFLTLGYAVTQDKAPYLDFFDHKPPAIYAVAAFFIHIWGNSWWWPRLLMAGVNLGSAYLLYLCGQKICPHRQQAKRMALIYLLLLPLVHGQFFGLEPWVNLGLLAAAYGLLCWRPEKRWLLLGTGICLGVASLFKQSAWLTWPVFGFWWWQRRRERPYLLGWGAGIALAAAGAYFGLRHQLPALWAAVVDFNLHHYPPQPGLQVAVQQSLIAAPFLPLWLAGLGGIKRIGLSSKYRWWQWLWLAFVPTLLLRGYHHYWIPLLPLISWWASATVKRDWIDIILGIYLTGIGVLFILYCWFRAYPALLVQLNTLSQEGCQRPVHPAAYYLNQCLPADYYFYQIPTF